MNVTNLMLKWTWKKQLLILLVPLFLIVAGVVVKNVFFVSKNSSSAGSPSWLDVAWLQQGAIIIDNTTNGSTLTNYQISFTIDTATLITESRLNSDCSDLRVTDSDGTTLLNFWVTDTTCNTVSTKIWVKVPSITASSTKTIYLYYDNSAATSVSSWDSTILPYSDTQLTSDFGSPRYSGGLLSYDGKLWIFGGRISAATPTGSRVSDVWNSTNGVTWTQVAATSSWGARNGFGYVVFNNKMWILGGLMDGTERKNDVWSSSDGITWTQETAAAGWGARADFAYTVFNNKIWIMGGSNGSNLHDVWSSPDGITWTQETAAAGWSIRQLFQAITFNNKMWVLAGASGPLNDIWSSSDGITWTLETATPAWPARSGFRAAVLDNKMWVAAGNGSSPTYKNDLWYSSDGITWTAATTSGNWQARTFFMMTAWNDRLILVGGTYFSGVSIFIRDVWSVMRTYTTPEPTITTILSPGVPTSLASSSITSTSMGLTWTAPSDTGGAAISDYVIEYSLTGIGSWTTFTDGVSSTTSATVTGLSHATGYDFRVSAVNSAGTGLASSRLINAVTSAILPGAPTGLSATTISTAQIDIAWTAPTNDGGSVITGYKIERKTEGGSFEVLVADTQSSATSYSSTSLTDSTTYYYRVSAINAIGASDASGEASAKTLIPQSSGGGGGGGAVSAPVNVSVSQNSSDVLQVLTIPVLLSANGLIVRPTLITNSSGYATVFIQKDTKVTTEDGKPYSGTISTPVFVSEDKLPAPLSANFSYAWAIVISTNQAITFDKEITITIPLKTGQNLAGLQVYYYDEKTGKYLLAGDGGHVAVDDKSIGVKVNHLTTFVAMGNTTPAVSVVDVVAETILPFSDIKDHWAEAYILKVFAAGIMTGATDGSAFWPDRTLTRGEMAKIAAVIGKYDIANPNSIFKDVDFKQWYSVYVDAVNKNGIMSGFPDNTFKPNKNLTRAEALKVLFAVTNMPLKPLGVAQFTDVKKGIWYENFVDTAYQNGIVGGKTATKFAPDDDITRAEMAKLISLFIP